MKNNQKQTNVIAQTTPGHSELPWILKEEYYDGPQWFFYSGKKCVGGTLRRPEVRRPEGWDDEDKANAAFIVRACNSHADLLAALKLVLDQVDYTIGNCSASGLPVGAVLDRSVIAIARAALAQAQGGGK